MVKTESPRSAMVFCGPTSPAASVSLNCRQLSKQNFWCLSTALPESGHLQVYTDRLACAHIQVLSGTLHTVTGCVVVWPSGLRSFAHQSRESCNYRSLARTTGLFCTERRGVDGLKVGVTTTSWLTSRQITRHAVPGNAQGFSEQGARPIISVDPIPRRD